MSAVRTLFEVVSLDPPAIIIAAHDPLDCQQFRPFGVLQQNGVARLDPRSKGYQVHFSVTQTRLHRWTDDAHSGQRDHPCILAGCASGSRY